MSQSSAQKKLRVFAFVPPNNSPRRYRERPARVFTTEEISLGEDMRELFDEVRDEEGRYPTPEFERVVRGDGWPWRILARYVVRAAKKGADEQRMLAIADRFTAFVRDVFRKYGHRDRKAA